MKMGLASILKLLAVVIIGLFVIKLGSKYLSGKFPNKMTNAADAVIQAA
jgi:hypothetical protein